MYNRGYFGIMPMKTTTMTSSQLLPLPTRSIVTTSISSSSASSYLPTATTTSRSSSSTMDAAAYATDLLNLNFWAQDWSKTPLNSLITEVTLYHRENSIKCYEYEIEKSGRSRKIWRRQFDDYIHLNSILSVVDFKNPNEELVLLKRILEFEHCDIDFDEHQKEYVIWVPRETACRLANLLSLTYFMFPILYFHKVDREHQIMMSKMNMCLNIRHEDHYEVNPLYKIILSILMFEDNPVRIRKVLEQFPETRKTGFQTSITKYNDTILHFAFRFGRVRVIEHAMRELRKGAHFTQNKLLESPLVWATYTDEWYNNSVFPALLKTFPAEWKCSDIFGNNLIHHILNTMRYPGLYEAGLYYFNCFLEHTENRLEYMIVQRNVFGVMPFNISSKLPSLEVFHYFLQELDKISIKQETILEVQQIKSQIQSAFFDRLNTQQSAFYRDLLLKDLPDSPIEMIMEKPGYGSSNHSAGLTVISILDDFGLEFFDIDTLDRFKESLLKQQQQVMRYSTTSSESMSRQRTFNFNEPHNDDSMDTEYDVDSWKKVKISNVPDIHPSMTEINHRYVEFKQNQKEIDKLQQSIKDFVSQNPKPDLATANKLYVQQTSYLFDLNEALVHRRLQVEKREDDLNQISRLGMLAKLMLEKEAQEKDQEDLPYLYNKKTEHKQEQQQINPSSNGISGSSVSKNEVISNNNEDGQQISKSITDQEANSDSKITFSIGNSKSRSYSHESNSTIIQIEE